MPGEAEIRAAAAILRQAAPEAEVFLFGSCARGEAHSGSDLDLLVVEPVVSARRHEIARLSGVLARTGIRADVLVVGRESFERWRRTPGMIVPEPNCPYEGLPAIRFGVKIWEYLSRPPSASR
ncbi:MAG TPA: nucleotidyltransferase domain-containing protein [Bryobacteraceae bacterium]|nr:nucleotidyltransferase domain-containing protein [Bryobacteraceae bacterium]